MGVKSTLDQEDTESCWSPTNVSEPLSVRDASTTAAKLGEVPIDEILVVAGCQSDSMFSKFHYKPIVNNSSAFAYTILD